MMLEQKQAIGDAWVDGRNIDAKGGLSFHCHRCVISWTRRCPTIKCLLA